MKKILLNINRRSKEKGYFDGKELRLLFNILKPNDMIWYYYVNNYLLGKDPKPNDLLYWDADINEYSV